MPATEVWTTRCTLPSAVGLALSRGNAQAALRDLGVTVRSLAESGDRRVREAHFTHALPGLVRQGGNIPPLVARSRGVNVRVVGLAWTETRSIVLTVPGSGITAPADLAGRRLALSDRESVPVDFWRATSLRTYERELGRAGLALGDVELVDVPEARSFIDDGRASGDAGASLWGTRAIAAVQRHEVLALLRGDVNAIASESQVAAVLIPYLDLREVAGADGDADPAGRVNNSVPLTLTAEGGLVDERPEAVASVIAAAAEAAAWAREHPARARALQARDIGLPEELVEEWYPRLHLGLDIDLDPARIGALAEQRDFLGRHGFLDGPLDLAAMIDRRPLELAEGLGGREAA